MIYQALAAVAAVVFLALAKDLTKLLRLVIHPYFSPLRNVPGPAPTHWFFGNLKEIIEADPVEMHEKWAKEFGPVLKYKVVMQQDRLSVEDLRAVAYVLGNSMSYEKPEPIRRVLTDLLGEGLLVVEGETHRQQRRVMNPAFGTAQIRGLHDTFLDKAIEMRDIWFQKIRSGEFEGKSGTPQTGQIEVVKWLSRMTLDVIGLAGFGYDFHSLKESQSTGEVAQAIRVILKSIRPGALDILHSLIPATSIIPSHRDREVKGARAALDRVSKQFLEERKAAVRLEGKVERKDFQDKDLLSLLVRANMASDVPESARMSDEEVLAQVPTFLLAGHETTATAVTWIIYALSLNPDVQDKLRAELFAASETDRPTMELLNSLPYLDAVAHETLRLYAPVSNTLRVATKDDVIPTEREWVDKHGVHRNGIPVTKGDSIFIPIMAINRSEEIWGPDAREYKPERWLGPQPPTVSSVPGVWGNILSFLGGPRACIGYRFSVLELKVLVYTLVRTFRFELAVKPEDIKFKSTAVTRPYLKDKIEAGPQLPCWVTPVEA